MWSAVRSEVSAASSSGARDRWNHRDSVSGGDGTGTSSSSVSSDSGGFGKVGNRGDGADLSESSKVTITGRDSPPVVDFFLGSSSFESVSLGNIGEDCRQESRRSFL